MIYFLLFPERNRQTLTRNATFKLADLAFNLFVYQVNPSVEVSTNVLIKQ